VLVLDEPTAALDLHYQLEVAVLLRRLNREQGLTMVVSTHDLHFAEQVCSAVVLLRDGQVLAAGLTASTLTPANVRALYGVAVDELHHPDGRRALVPAGLAEDPP
jgi:ABC-type cobalamin/Fe3+-siderophores transport system ATPase subunit